MLGRGNWNSFTFRELKNNVKVRTMRGWSFWHGLNAPGERDSSRREETHKTCNALSVSQLSLCLHGKANVCAERRMKCDASSGQTRAGPGNAGRGRRYLSEVGQHVGTSLTHLGEEDDGRVQNTCGTGRRDTAHSQRNGSLAMWRSGWV